MALESYHAEASLIADTSHNIVAFEQVFDKRLTSNIKMVKWCPTMDLLALVTSTPEEAIWIHRLSWQRLWCLTVPEKKAIMTICWSPDGSQQALFFFSFFEFCVY
jgi:hypothetical protein